MSWKITSTTASISNSDWNLQTDFEQPDLGWSIGKRGAPELKLLGVTSEISIGKNSDVYSSGNDLIIDFSAQCERNISLRLRSRVIGLTESRLVLQTTLGIQTRSFDAHPKICLTFPPAQQIGDTFVFDNPGYQGALVFDGANPEIRQQDSRLMVFSDFLERGVIRKCRWRLIVVREGAGGIDAESELNALRDEPLPLLS